MDRPVEENDAFFQKTRENIVSAFTTARLLDHHGNECVHIGINRIFHRALPVASSDVLARKCYSSLSSGLGDLQEHPVSVAVFLRSFTGTRYLHRHAGKTNFNLISNY